MAGPFETPRLIRGTAWPWGGVLLGRLGGAWSGGRGPWLEAPWGGAGGLGLGGSQTGIPPLTPRLQQARGALTLELPGDPSGLATGPERRPPQRLLGRRRPLPR